MCEFKIEFARFEEYFNTDFNDYFKSEMQCMTGFVNDGILELAVDEMKVTPLGRFFIRNIAMVFDAYLNKEKKVVFSQTI